MAKTVYVEETATTFFLPARDVLAVWNATSSEETRYYLKGVYVEQHDKDGIQLIATDGHVLLRKPVARNAFIGADVSRQATQFDRGFILALDTADKAMKAKTVGDAWLYGDTATGIVQVLDVDGKADKGYRRVGVLEFDRIDGTFPDWRRILPAVEPGFAGASVCVELAKLVQMQKAAKVYGRNSPVRITAGEAGAPMLIEFGSDCEGLTGIVMPLRWANVS